MERSSQSVGDGPAIISADQTDMQQARVRPGLRSDMLTIKTLVDGYMAEYAGRDSSRAQRLQYWVARLGSLTVGELTDDHVFDTLEQLAARHGRYFAGVDADGRPILKAKSRPLAPATINRYQAALSALLTWAQRRRVVPRNWTNPCRHIELKAERNEVVRFLSEAERAALLQACRQSKWPKLYVLVLMGLTTGARRGELEALRWGDIDLERREASVVRSKNGDRKTLVLVPAVVEELRAHVGQSGKLVFASNRKPDVAFNFVPAWQGALRLAGVRSFRFHDLRHSCASALAQNGASLLEIADVLGHRQLSVTKRYSHLATGHKSQLINRVLGEVR